MIIPCIKRREGLIKKVLSGKKIIKVSLFDLYESKGQPYNIKIVLDDGTIVLFMNEKSSINTMDIKVIKYEKNNKATWWLYVEIIY